MPIKNYPIRLSAISMFFERAFKVDDEYVRILDKEYTEEEWDGFGESEHDYAFDALIEYQEIVTRAVLGELNALVEYELNWVAKSIRRKHHGKSLGAEKKLSREKACGIIENEFHVKLKNLPGFSEVDEIRKVANAYKHDAGYSGKYEPFFIGSMEKKYELDPDIAEKYLSAVKEFLQALPGEKLNLGEDIRTKA
jgi:hypothetical protein